jgi:hypothetical protein
MKKQQIALSESKTKALARQTLAVSAWQPLRF